MEKLKTLFLYYGPHPFHERLAKTVNADFLPVPHLSNNPNENLFKKLIRIINFEINIPKGYDIYLCEGTFVFPAFVRKFGFFKKALIINITADPLLYYLKAKKIRAIGRFFFLSMLNEVNSFICVGEMEKKLLLSFIPNAKTIIAYPFIVPNVSRMILKKSRIIPDLESHKILIIARNDAYYKGIDILIEAFQIIKNKYADAELKIVGNVEVPNEYKSIKDVNFMGFCKDILKIIKEASIYVHPGRGDAFSVSSIEAMLSGLPAIVSKDTGSSEVIIEINKHLVTTLNPKDVAESIDWYFKLSYKQKLNLSKKVVISARRFNEKEMIAKFKKDYQSLLKQIVVK
jgi:glycosyltransferase involved in cell wall biosynthesis